MSAESKQWLAAGIILAEDPMASIPCPHCNQNQLKIQDIFSKGVRSEARIYCANCRAQNFLLFASPKLSESDESNGKSSVAYS